MIVRMWHGRVPSEIARAYREFLNARAIPDYQSTPGNISVTSSNAPKVKSLISSP